MAFRTMAFLNASNIVTIVIIVFVGFRALAARVSCLLCNIILSILKDRLQHYGYGTVNKC